VKPNVLINIDTYAIGGPGKLILQFLKNGGRDICNPLVAGFWRGPEGKWQFRDAVEELSVDFAVLRQAFAYDPLVLMQAYRLTRKSDINILESHGYKSHVICLALKRLLGIPWIAYVHGWTSENLKVELYNRLEKKLVRFADRIVPVSHNLGERLALGSDYAKKLSHIPNAVEPVAPDKQFADVRSQLGISETTLLLAVVGRLSPEKGHRYLLEALPTLLKACTDIKVVFVGDGQEREALLADIDRLCLKECVKLAGYQEDVSSFFNACDVLVMPSLSEGMPMAALEAMSFAKPVVATLVGGIPEVVVNGKTGLLVEPQNPAALAYALSDLLHNVERMKEFGCAGRARVESEFGPAARVRSVDDLYQRVLKV
jgi:glycosyltransferase involved in cell wall biosynthesis